MSSFWKSETFAIIKAMKATGNRQGVVAKWKGDVAAWAECQPVTDLDAASVLAWLPSWQVRPFYTAAELAPIWPALAIAVGAADQWPAVPKSAHRLAHELDFGGLPRLRKPFERYYIVERLHYWGNPSRTWKELEDAFD